MVKLNKNKKTLEKRQGIKKSKTMKVNKRDKLVSKKISNKKKSNKSVKKSKKVLLSKLVTRNKLKKMMKGGANSKYESLMKSIEQNPSNITEIDLSYVETSTPQQSTESNSQTPSQESQGWFSGIASGITGTISGLKDKFTGSNKESPINSTQFKTLMDLFRSKVDIAQITSINLTNNSLTSLDESSFEGFDSVTTLNLSNNNFTNESVIAIFNTKSDKKMLPNLQSLILTGNPKIQDLTTSLKELNPSIEINLDTENLQSSENGNPNASS